MKTSLFAVLLAYLVCAFATSAADDPVRKPFRQEDIFTATVLKDLSFRDDSGEYVAYLVKWKTHYAVVADTVWPKPRYAIGDTIRCRAKVFNGRVTIGRRDHLSFTLAPPELSPAVQARLAALKAKSAATKSPEQAAKEEAVATALAKVRELDAEIADTDTTRFTWSDPDYLSQLADETRLRTDIHKRNEVWKDVQTQIKADIQRSEARIAETNQAMVQKEEFFTAPILRDLSFKDGDADYIAYMVQWKNHYVVVANPVWTKQHYAIGAPIRCKITQRTIADRNGGREQLTFSIALPNRDTLAQASDSALPLSLAAR